MAPNAPHGPYMRRSRDDLCVLVGLLFHVGRTSCPTVGLELRGTDGNPDG